MNKLDELLQKFRIEIGADFISTDIVGMEDGLSIAGASATTDFDNSEISALFTAVMSLAARVSTKLNFGTLDDNLITTNKFFITSRLLGDGSYYWGLAVAKTATLGVLRIRMNEYATQIWDSIPH
jgi:predicted regulator of Ras-like GTPase activity (Roadblock/LC7/MglB family)